MKTGSNPEDIQAIRTSEFFDESWYLSSFPDVGALGMDAAEHYLWIGARLNRNPSARFSTRGYLAANVDVADCGTNPLLHYVRHGHAEGRTWVEEHGPSVQEEEAGRYVAVLPADLEGEILNLPISDRQSAAIDVVIPVYRSRTETLSCIWHVLRSRNTTTFELVVIDDCSPEPALSESLEKIARAGHITLLKHDKNQGFVRTVNRGMQLHEDRDVILLNSDTEVYGNWIDRLRAVASEHADCGTVTPLTNCGTVCSYPFFVKDNHGTLELSFEELDGLAAQVNRGQVVGTPTAVGFCMYIKRKMIRQVGYFDADAFGRGYGEENDFCLRGQKAGWRDLIAADTFVRHVGGVSFQADKAELIRKNLALISERYPRYHEDVRAYIELDPVRPMRERLDIARLAKMRREKNVLVISHQRGGGVDRCVRDFIRAQSAGNTSVFLMHSDKVDPLRVRHAHPDVAEVPNVGALNLEVDADRIVSLWDSLGISEVHVHHIIDYGAEGARKIGDLLSRAGRPYVVYVHDYLAICPRISLSDESGFYCGEPDDRGCNRCLSTRGGAVPVRRIEGWREAHGNLLRAADKVITPDPDVSERMHRYFPDIRFESIAHESHLPVRKTVRGWPSGTRKLRVGTLGGISDIKGFNVLVECALDARRRGLPLEFVVVGHTANDNSARAAGVRVTGRYREGRLEEKMAAEDLDAIVLLSVWPETYSYTLSAALGTDLPIAVFDIGAPARRVRGVPGSIVLPLEVARQPGLLNDKLLEWAKRGTTCATATG